MRAPLHITIPAPVGATPTRRACEAARRFGLTLDSVRAGAHRFALDPAPGRITLAAGPSGCGKSRLLRACEAGARERGWRVIRPERMALRAGALVDQRRSLSLDAAMRLLSRAGLGEAACFVRRPGELSGGQRERLLLALAMHAAEAARPGESPALLILDEFAATLDAVTADAVARLLRRWIGASQRAAAVVATAREGMEASLAPDTVVRFEGGTPVVSRGVGVAQALPVVIDRDPSSRDVRDALQRLSPLHYRGARPASVVATLLARRPETGETMGYMSIAMPTLNARWRCAAWPGAFDQRDKHARALRINERLRRIARVVVDPRVRALGVATRMVGSYLANPLTPCTESVAAMGQCCSFFERAGMTAHHLPPAPSDARLLDALAHLGVDPWRLATPGAALDRALREPGGAALLQHELDHWSRATRARRVPAGMDEQDLAGRFAYAASRVCEGVTAFTHGECAETEEEGEV